MTDNEIITKQSFEEKLTHFKKETKDFFATYHNKSGGEDCIEVCLIRDGYRTVLKAEEVITRLKAENERLSHEIHVLKSENSFLLKSKGGLKMNKEFEHEIKQSKLEAIKEFAERLKEKRIKPIFPWDDFFVTEGIIDEVLKEMVGDTDA